MAKQTPHIHIEVGTLLNMTDVELSKMVTHPDGIHAARKDLIDMLAEGQLYFVVDPNCNRQSNDGLCACNRRPRDCQLCSDSRAVGKYYVEKYESNNYGWWRVCKECALNSKRLGAQVYYYKYTQEYKVQNDSLSDLPDVVMSCSHDFRKWSLVSSHDKYKNALFDWYRCEHCQVYGKKFGLGYQPILDLMMEIDLSCIY